MIVRALLIDDGLRRELVRWPSAERSLRLLERSVREGRDLSPARFKPSGRGRVSTFEPYLKLKLHHAKLDYEGRHGGNPLLVFQMTVTGEMRAVAVSTHADFVSVDPSRCRNWLWANRDALDWELSVEAENVLQDLTQEFAAGAPDPGKTGR